LVGKYGDQTNSRARSYIMRQHVARLSTVLLGDAQIEGTIAYDNTVSGLEADTVKEAIDEVAAQSGGGGLTLETLTFNSGSIANSATEEVTVLSTQAGVLLSAKVTRTAGTSNDVKVTLSQQPGFTAGELAVIGGSMPDGENLTSGVTYGPGYRSGGEVLAPASKIRPVDGGYTLIISNGSYTEGENLTVTVELVILPLDF